MYNFYYNVFKPIFKERAKLLFTDTDSLCYATESNDVYEELKPHISQWFDTSDYPKDFANKDFPVGMNKKVIGLFKDECAGM